MSKPVNATEARSNLGKLLDRVSKKGERIVVKRRKKSEAVLVSVKDAEKLKTLEDQADKALIRKALRSKKTVTLQQVKRRLAR